MKRCFTLLAIAGIAVTAAAPAQAFTKWSTFEYKGYTVKARYNDGTLRYIKATNQETGEAFRGHVNVSGVAILDVDGQTIRVSLDDAETRIRSRGEIRDLAQVQ